MATTTEFLMRADGTAVPASAVRVRTHLGTGRLMYLTRDGFAGVQLDGERRVDEYPGYVVQVVR